MVKDKAWTYGLHFRQFNSITHSPRDQRGELYENTGNVKGEAITGWGIRQYGLRCPVRHLPYNEFNEARPCNVIRCYAPPQDEQADQCIKYFYPLACPFTQN